MSECCSAKEKSLPATCCGGGQKEPCGCHSGQKPKSDTGCCSTPAPSSLAGGCCGGRSGKKIDWLFWGSAALVILPMIFMVAGLPLFPHIPEVQTYIHSIHEFVSMAWWGVVIGIVFLSLLAKIPREFVMSVLGNDKGAKGIVRAMAAGVLLDLCNHGILMVSTKLYQRGASVGQVMAFLVASPWNSLSMTLILMSMIGFGYTMLFIALSCVVAFVTGMIFDALVSRGTLPKNPNAFDMPDDFRFWAEAKKQLSTVQWSPRLFLDMVKGGLSDSRMVIRWLLVGIVLASVLRVVFTPDDFSQFFGPTAIGLLATLAFATVLEVCSEGSSPIAADMVTRAAAPGNGFTFLMAGASTDYTEIMVLRDMTKSWKIAIFLPLITVPQIVALGYLLNL